MRFMVWLVSWTAIAESIKERYRFHRLCTSQVRGWEVYVEYTVDTLLDCGGYICSRAPLQIQCHPQYTVLSLSPSSVRQIINQIAILIS
jgi:hypothetical protein